MPSFSHTIIYAILYVSFLLPSRHHLSSISPLYSSFHPSSVPPPSTPPPFPRLLLLTSILPHHDPFLPSLTMPSIPMRSPSSLHPLFLFLFCFHPSIPLPPLHPFFLILLPLFPSIHPSTPPASFHHLSSFSLFPPFIPVPIFIRPFSFFFPSLFLPPSPHPTSLGIVKGSVATALRKEAGDRNLWQGSGWSSFCLVRRQPLGSRNTSPSNNPHQAQETTHNTRTPNAFLSLLAL